MTGPEKETLTQALELQRAVLTSLDAFRSEVRTDIRAFRSEMITVVTAIEDRLSVVELSETAHTAEMVGVNRFLTGRRELVKIWVAAASVGATAGAVVWGIFQFIRV